MEGQGNLVPTFIRGMAGAIMWCIVVRGLYLLIIELCSPGSLNL